ncbi:MAG TPA: hypothetical protein VKE25_00700 [Actinomycetes bacterium]|nr:hypothetical protein [Actinomycetes bacterium]
MIWIVIYVTLGLATLSLIAIAGWRVFVAARKLGLTVQRSQQRVGEVMPPLQAALDEMAAYDARYQSNGGNSGGHDGPGRYGSKISRADQLARWDSIRPAPWTTDGRQASRLRTTQDGAERDPKRRADHGADQRG